MPRTLILLLTLSVSALLLAGCGRDEGRDATEGHGDHDRGSASMHDDDGDHDHGDHAMHDDDGGHDHGDHAMHGDGDHDSHGDIADLPEGANEVCPVMGGPVDPAIFTEYKGKKVYFCCDECVEKFKKDPERYFGKAYPDAGSR